MEDAIKLAEPKAQTFSLPRGTITDQDEPDAYVAKLKKDLEYLLKNTTSIILN